MLKILSNLRNKGKEPVLTLNTFIEGQMMPLKKVPDEVFSKRILGEGVAVFPEGEVLYAPVDSEVTSVMRTCHSCCLCAAGGLEILLHIGINTVEMKGEGFEVFVKAGQKVRAGEPLIRFDLEKIAAAGHSPVSLLILTDMGIYHDASFKSDRKAQKGDIIGELY